jgi:hypothetical protein
MTTPRTPFDLADIDRRRVEAYQQIPALRQQARDDAVAALQALWQVVWRRATAPSVWRSTTRTT